MFDQFFPFMPRITLDLTEKNSPYWRDGNRIGPGRKTLHTYWKNVYRSKKYPHSSERQRQRVLRRLERARAKGGTHEH